MVNILSVIIFGSVVVETGLSVVIFTPTEVEIEVTLTTTTVELFTNVKLVNTIVSVDELKNRYET